MEELFYQTARAIVLGLEIAAVVVVTIGSVGAAARIVMVLVRQTDTRGVKKAIWRRYGMWLLLGLEFELASDIVTSVLSPTWQDLAQLGAIAVIRTFLNYFLEKDVSEADVWEPPAARPTAETA